MGTTQTACVWDATHHSNDMHEIHHGTDAPLYACGYHLESVGVTRLAQAQHKCRECGTTDLSTNEPTCGTCFNARARREPMVSADELVRHVGRCTMSTTDDTDNRYRAWGSIGKDYRTTDADGVRWVMVLEPGVGTCLVRWIGPERCPVHRLPGCECNAMTTTPGGAA